MKKQKLLGSRWLLLAMVIMASMILLAACNLPGIGDSKTDPIELAKQTLVAIQTQDYFQTVVAQLTQVPPGEKPTEPPIGGNPTTPTDVPPTQVQPTVVPPTAVPPTAVPATSVPTAVPTVVVSTPVATATPVPCYQITFVSDVSIPDGTKIPGGNSFTKTWRLKNTGSCTWDNRFDVAFVKGTQLSAQKVYDLNTVVKPGETVDISIDMTAPTTNGEYKSEWQLLNPNGEAFGIGEKSNRTFFALIEVVDGKGAVYNFAESACKAKWSSDKNGSLPCPGDRKKNTDGFVLYEKNPIREDGGKENEPGLITQPSKSLSQAYIQGVYPEIAIRNGDRFKATIQCEGGAKFCSLKFELYYQIDGGKFIELGEWHEMANNDWTEVDIDLSGLAGKKVVFSLVVWNRSTNEDNIGLWLNPIIYRP